MSSQLSVDDIWGIFIEMGDNGYTDTSLHTKPAAD